MFKRIKCNKCENRYDEAFNECPNCHAPNTNLAPEFKNIQMLSIGKQLGLFAMGFGGFEFLAFIISLIISKTSLMSLNETLLNMLLNSIVYFLLFISLIAIVNIDFKKIFKNFTSWKPYIAGICAFLAIMIIGIIYSLILQAAGVSISSNDNQQAIDVSSTTYPLTSLIIFGLIGPICEELTYRLGLFSFLKRISKWLAYPITVLIFAVIHFNFSASSLTNELFNLPYYLIAGFILTFTYDKFGFAGSTFAHVLNNIISLIPAFVAIGVIH